MRHLFVAVALAAALASAACLDSLSPTTPETSTVMASVSTGTYASASLDTRTDQVCTNFQWTITNVTATGMAGTFSALCNGTMRVTGTARGSLSGTTVTWVASGNAVTPTTSVCAVSLTGKAEISRTQIRVPYTGTTCMGPVSGTEILIRK